MSRKRSAVLPPTIRLVIALAWGLGSATTANAQFEGYLEKVTDVNVFFSCWDTPGNLKESHNCISEQSGYGIEVLWALSPLKGAANSDVFFELGFGYSQFGGFSATDTTYEIRGTVRDLPSVTLYATWQGGEFSRYVKPYLGLRSGLISLQNVQIYDAFDAPNDSIGAVYSGTAQAFQLGPVVGLAVGGDRLYLNGEAAYLLRRLPSIQWTSAGTNKVPSRFPRDLDFTGVSFSIGLQFRIRDPKS